MLFEHDVETGRWSWSPGLRQLHGLAADGAPTTELLLAHVVDEERESMRQRLSEYAANPGSYSCTVQMRDGQGALRRVRYVCQSETGGGEVKRIIGFVIDITGMMRDHANQAVEGAVEHRAVIEQAKGALMVSFGIDEVAASELLRGYSSRANTKLVQVAEHIVDGVSSDRFSREEPVRSLLDICWRWTPRAFLLVCGAATTDPPEGTIALVPSHYGGAWPRCDRRCRRRRHPGTERPVTHNRRPSAALSTAPDVDNVVTSHRSAGPAASSASTRPGQAATKPDPAGTRAGPGLSGRRWTRCR